MGLGVDVFPRPFTSHAQQQPPHPLPPPPPPPQDYFTDLQTWLPDFFFAHVVRAALEGLIVLYIAAVLRGRTLLGDPERAHQRMRRDKQGLIDEFAPYRRQLEEQGVADVLVPVSACVVGDMCGAGGVVVATPNPPSLPFPPLTP